MLLRSHSQCNKSEIFTTSAPQSDDHQESNRKPALDESFLQLSEAEQHILCSSLFEQKYNDQPRSLQISSVISLIKKKNTFLIAATGYGKTRIAELFYHLHAKDSKPIVLILNPLDALGDDQVAAKEAAGLRAINLTQDNMTTETKKDVLKGEYQFLYVSPEIFLKNTLFSIMFFDKRFQARLILKVVDEAHMIYTWGLVESGKAKHLTSHLKVQDRGPFRPAYGNLGRRFLATENVPLLMMSATCPPQQVRSILDNLKMKDSDVHFHHGELVRPEIRLLRRTFMRPLTASLSNLFGPKELVKNSDLPPTLIYSSDQNGTLAHLKIINISRRTPADAFNALSPFAQRYHATTGHQDKLNRVERFSLGLLAVICCTLALGLGQNWTRVRRVVVVGRQDPSITTQMIGRGGRDGRQSLGIMLVESSRTHGKNKSADFTYLTNMTEDDRMDAYAITMVCLRIALGADLRLGYVPLTFGDPAYISESIRQQKAGFPPCDCSNCKPEEAEALWLAQALLTNENFDVFLKMTPESLIAASQRATSLPMIINDAPPPVIYKFTKNSTNALEEHRQRLSNLLQVSFSEFFHSTYAGPCDFGPEDLFSEENSRDIALNIQNLDSALFLNDIIGSEAIKGSNRHLWETCLKWKLESPEGTMIEAQRSTMKRKRVKKVQSVEGALIDRATKDLARSAKAAACAAKKQEMLETRARRRLAKGVHTSETACTSSASNEPIR